MPEPDMCLLVSERERGRVLQAHNFSREEIKPGFKGAADRAGIGVMADIFLEER